MMRRRIAIAVGIAIALGGCVALSPPPELPADSLQRSWQQEGQQEGQQEAWQQESTETPAAADINPHWWLAFNDASLNQLMQHALQHNLDLRAASARVLEANALRKSSDAQLWPRFDAALDVTRARALSRDAENDGGAQSESPRTTAQAGINASWEADISGRLRHAARAAAADVQALEADRDAVRLAVLAEVARNYIEYRQYVAQYTLAQKNAQAQRSTVRMTQARFREGMASRLDLERAQTQFFTTQATVPQALEQMEASRARLALLLAMSPEQLEKNLPRASEVKASADVAADDKKTEADKRQFGEVVTDATLKAIPDADAGAVLLTPAQVLAQRADVRAAERRLAAAAEQLQATGALRYPTLNLAGMIGVASDDVGDLFSASDTRVWSASGGLLAPLFDFGRIRAQIDAADARQQQAYLAYEQSVRSALADTQAAIVYYTQSVQRQRALQDAVTAARKAAELAHRNYAAGTLSLLDVLVAEQSLYDSELAWSQATANVSLRLVSLWQAMGVVPAPFDSAQGPPGSGP
jgi:outer membrane protein TolC